MKGDADDAEARVLDLVAAVWEEEVESWAAEGLDDEDMRVVEELGLLEEFEFFWDGEVDRVGYEAPSIPRDWKAEHDEVIRSWGQASKLNMALGDLGQRVRERVEERLGVEGP